MPTKKHTTTEKAQKAPKSAKRVYVEGIGRRKTAVARVRIFNDKHAGGGTPGIMVNGKPLGVYFPHKRQQLAASAPLSALSLGETSVVVTVRATGGGYAAQAEALRLGLSRALVLRDPAVRPRLKTLGYLMRDSRMVERKKFGSRKARRPQQWRKR